MTAAGSPGAAWMRKKLSTVIQIRITTAFSNRPEMNLSMSTAPTRFFRSGMSQAETDLRLNVDYFLIQASRMDSGRPEAVVTIS
ncbi:hypothetical protein D3C80_907380 [compost metagenome]